MGKKFLTCVTRFIYDQPVTLDTVKQMRHVRNRQENELAQEHTGVRDIKIGYGGLMDIEFTVQLCQLRNGANMPELQTTNTFDALTGIRHKNCLPVQMNMTMEKAYRFLRRLENRLRIVHDSSIHTFSQDPEKIERLAKRLDYVDEPDTIAGELLLRDYRETTREVRDIFEYALESIEKELAENQKEG